MRRLLYAGLAALFALHNDWWLWSSDARFAGLPVGLAYHLGYCIAVVVVMAAMVRWAWPGSVGGGDDAP